MTADAVHLVIVAVRWSAGVFYWTGVVVWVIAVALSVLWFVRIVARIAAWLWGGVRADVLVLREGWRVRGDVAEWQRGKR